MGRLSGVVGVAVIRESFEDQRVAINRGDDPTAIATRAQIYGLSSGGFAALEARIQGPGWQQWHDDTAQRVVVLSRSTAAAVGAETFVVGQRPEMLHGESSSAGAARIGLGAEGLCGTDELIRLGS